MEKYCSKYALVSAMSNDSEIKTITDWNKSLTRLTVTRHKAMSTPHSFITYNALIM